MVTNCIAKNSSHLIYDEEQDLVRRTAEGDEQAYAQLVSRYSPPVFRFLHRMLASREDAEDLTQDTFFELFKHRRGLRTDAHVLPYLFTIARRKAISQLRRRNVRRVLKPMTSEHENTVAGPNPTPRDRMHDSHVEEIVDRAIAKLKPDKRAAMILRFFEKLSYTDIAKIMQKPDGTVKSLVFRAERELRQQLSGIEAVWRR